MWIVYFLLGSRPSNLWREKKTLLSSVSFWKVVDLALYLLPEPIPVTLEEKNDDLMKWKSRGHQKRGHYQNCKVPWNFQHVIRLQRRRKSKAFIILEWFDRSLKHFKQNSTCKGWTFLGMIPQSLAVSLGYIRVSWQGRQLYKSKIASSIFIKLRPRQTSGYHVVCHGAVLPGDQDRNLI